jgi:hypothetical protein
MKRVSGVDKYIKGGQWGREREGEGHKERWE